MISTSSILLSIQKKVGSWIDISGALRYISENTFLVSVTLILLIIVFFVTYIGILRWLRNPSDRLVKKLREYDEISILMHENPDPDSMSSAMGLSRIARENGVNTEILYPGIISHDENRAFRAVLDVDFRNIESADETQYNNIALVDHHRTRGLKNGDDIVPDIVVDHHTPEPDNMKELCSFWYIDDTAGSCASIITQFMREQNIIIPESDIDSVSKESTALYHGIKSDTNNLSKGVSKLDFKGINLLYDFVDEQKLFRIANPKVSSESLETKARSIINREVRSPFCVSDVGPVENPDSIPRCSDEIVRLEGISCAVVLGYYDGDLRISGRSYDDRVHIGNVLRRMTEEMKFGNGGGHSRMAGAKIPDWTNKDIEQEEIIENVFTCLSKY